MVKPVAAPDGGIIEFPDDMTDEAIAAVMRKQFPPKYDEAAAKERMYEGRAKYMRESSPKMTAVRDTVQRFVEGMPFGSYVEDAIAGLSSTLPQSLGGSGMSYEDAKGVLDADRRIRDRESTVLGTLPLIGDVTAGGVNKLAGGVASATLTPMVRAVEGVTMLPRAINAMINGGLYGAFYGFGEGNTLEERGRNAMIGGGIGSGFGAAAVPAAQGVGNLVGRVRQRNAPLPQELQQYNRESVRRVNETMEMDGITPSQAGMHVRSLGDEGMLADVGENLTTITEGIAQQPGPGRALIPAALNDRTTVSGGGAAGRIRQSLDDNIGPPLDLDATVEQLRTHANQQARPYYQQFEGMRIPNSHALNTVISRIRQAAPSVLSEARRQAAADGVNARYIANLVDDPMTPMTGVQGTRMERAWHGAELDYIKRAVDDIAWEAGRGTNAHRQFTQLSRQLRDVVDNAVSPNNPAQSPWAIARAIGHDGRGAERALELGETVFRNGGKAPETVAAEIRNLNQFQREVYNLAARSGLRNMMGRRATDFGPSGDRAARRALNSEFNRENVNIVAGTQAGQRIANTIDAENTFADTANQVLNNSATSRRQAARDMIPRQYDAANMRQWRGTSISGLAMEAVGRITNHLTAGALNARNSAIARDMAEMLIARGADRDQIVRGLIEYARQVRGNAQQRAAIAEVARDLMSSTSRPAIGAATAD